MLRVGVDIVEVGRIDALRARFGERFKRRVFSDAEWATGTRAAPSLAARFAAKEAAIKALGSRSIAYHEIEVTRGTDEPPRLQLNGRAHQLAEQLGVQEIALSLSHTREHAVAVVVLRDAPARAGDEGG